MMKKGISPLIATVVIVGVSIYLALAVALWELGIIGLQGYGTRVVELKVMYPESYGRLFKFMVRNLGGEKVYIDQVYVNNLPAKVRLAFNWDDPSVNYIYYKPQDVVNIPVGPGETFVIYAIVSEPMKAGVAYDIKIHTTIGFEQHVLLQPELGIDVGRLASVRLIAFNDINWWVWDWRNTGFNGWMVEFDPTTWEYSMWNVQNQNPWGYVTDPRDFLFIGANGQTGDIFNLPPPLYKGDAPIVISSSARAIDFTSYPFTPIVLVMNLYSYKQDFNFTWYNQARRVDTFIMERLSKVVSPLDFIILWEDQVDDPNSPNGSIKSGTDPYSWVDHAVRVSWLKTGQVRIGVYRASGWYLHVFLLGTNYVYFKPHGDYWDPQYSDLDNYGYAWYTGDYFYYYEIGYDGGYWISPNGYNVTVWYVG